MSIFKQKYFFNNINMLRFHKKYCFFFINKLNYIYGKGAITFKKMQ